MKLVKIEAVDSMASRVDGFGPKDVLSLVLVQHGSCHLNKSSVLPLNYPILLRGIWNSKFMLDALFIKKLFNIGVPKFRVIVTSYFLDGQTEFPLCSSYEGLHLSLYFTFIKKEHPREA